MTRCQCDRCTHVPGLCVPAWLEVCRQRALEQQKAQEEAEEEEEEEEDGQEVPFCGILL